jgi:hypothetical protein
MSQMCDIEGVNCSKLIVLSFDITSILASNVWIEEAISEHGGGIDVSLEEFVCGSCVILILLSVVMRR